MFAAAYSPPVANAKKKAAKKERSTKSLKLFSF
jgi:hypothetical protein